MTPSMTAELIEKMPCGRAMDALIAYSFYHWDMNSDFDTHTGGILFVDMDSHFSTNIQNAFALVEKLPRQFQLFSPFFPDGGWVGKFIDLKTGLHFNGCGTTIAGAICRASLLRLFSLDLTGATDKYELGRILDEHKGAL